MEWDPLMSQARLRAGTEARSKYDGRTPYESDYERVVFASSFRRLDGKAQVFSQVDHDFIRTRLPHTIEVAALGSAMAVSAMEYLRRHRILLLPEPRDAGAVVGTACLLHDLGNPPFGHKGEEAIRRWASDYVEQNGDFEGSEDFLNFDGNAQSFRLAVRLQNSGKPGGMNLTAATLACTVKYPWPSSRCGQIGKSKFGYFRSDTSAFKRIMELCRIPDGRRHPLALLMEAADDLANAVSDVEDAVRYGKIGFETLLDSLKSAGTSTSNNLYKATVSQLKGALSDEDFPEEDAQHRAIQHLRAMTLGELRSSCVQEFVTNYDEIIAGVYEGSLTKKMKESGLRELFSRLVEEHVFKDAEVVARETAGSDAIHSALSSAIRAPPTSRPRGRLALSVDEHNVDETYAKVQTAVDYVSGMTDSYVMVASNGRS